jgi:hypothetical protein
MNTGAGWPGRSAHPNEGEPALTPDERRRFAEIARRIERDVEDEPATAAVVPPRLAAVGLFVVAGTGAVAGLARADVVVLAVVGIVPAVAAVLLLTLPGARRSAAPPSRGPLAKRFWWWLTTCAESGCREHPVHLGWCREHAPRSDPAPDEFWG